MAIIHFPKDGPCKLHDASYNVLQASQKYSNKNNVMLPEQYNFIQLAAPAHNTWRSNWL